MLKSLAILAIPSVVGGIGVFYNAPEPPFLQYKLRAPYIVEVGVTFPEAAIRGALPEGLEPAPGLTGGVAIYGGDEGWALSPLSTGYVWIDLAEPQGAGGPSRYMVLGFATDDHEQGPLGTPDGTLRATAGPDPETLVDVTLRPGPRGCANVLSEELGPLLTAGPGGSLGVIHMPVLPDLCEAQAVSVAISAPASHLLGGLAPERVLWAGLATPLGGATPELPAE